MVYQDVMRNENISIEAKAIYGYLSSIAGNSGVCYPSIDTICRDLKIGKNRLSKHLSQLIALGVVERTREKKGNIYGRNLYKITHEVEVQKELKTIFEGLQVEGLENRGLQVEGLENEVINNNNTNNNSINNNRVTIDYQRIADMYNDTCVSFPRLTVLSEKRKKTIRARLNTYTVEDFKRLFEMAESSSFLKGQNARNWSATFDWLTADANMAKVLDGNYDDKKASENIEEQSSETRRPASAYYEQFLGGGESIESEWSGIDFSDGPFS